MHRETTYCCLIYIIALFIFLFPTSKVLAQQKIFSQKNGSLKTGMITVYLHWPDRHDTTFQSTDNNFGNSGINNSGNKLSAKIYSPFGSTTEITREYSMEGAITLTINITPTSCGYGNGSIVVSATGGIAPYTFFASVDPYHQQRGIGGLPGRRKQVEPIWAEFNLFCFNRIAINNI